MRFCRRKAQAESCTSIAIISTNTEMPAARVDANGPERMTAVPKQQEERNERITEDQDQNESL